jgi:hypothetical protein
MHTHSARGSDLLDVVLVMEECTVCPQFLTHSHAMMTVAIMILIKFDEKRTVTEGHKINSFCQKHLKDSRYDKV